MQVRVHGQVYKTMTLACEALNMPVEDVFFKIFNPYVPYWNLVYEAKEYKTAGHAVVVWDPKHEPPGYWFFRSKRQASASDKVAGQSELSRWLNNPDDIRARSWDELSVEEKQKVLNPPEEADLLAKSQQGTAIYVEVPFGSGNYTFYPSVFRAYNVTGLDTRRLSRYANDASDTRAYWAYEKNPKHYWKP